MQRCLRRHLNQPLHHLLKKCQKLYQKICLPPLLLLAQATLSFGEQLINLDINPHIHQAFLQIILLIIQLMDLHPK